LRRRHWSLDLIQLHTVINSRHDTSIRRSKIPTPLRLLLHLKPRADSTLATSSPSNSQESCRIAFISLLKEADYIRWGNTRRITGLRRADLESAWDGIVDSKPLRLPLSHGLTSFPDDYETHSRFVQKIVPLPLPPPKSSDPTQAQAPENLGVSGPESCFAVRSIPLKLYLPGNAPEVQDIVNPLNARGELNSCNSDCC
jgi:autophagy-related protein 5